MVRELSPLQQGRAQVQEQQRRPETPKREPETFDEQRESHYERFRQWLDGFDTSDDAISSLDYDPTPAQEEFITSYLAEAEE